MQTLVNSVFPRQRSKQEYQYNPSMTLVVCFLCAVDVCTELALLVPQTRLLLATHGPAGHDHHNRLIACLFAVR